MAGLVSFAETVALVPAAAEGVWELRSGSLSAAYNIGKAPNGGFVTALLGHALMLEVQRRWGGTSLVWAAASGTFFLPPVPGRPLSIHCEVLKRGATTTVMRGVLQQDQRIRTMLTGHFLADTSAVELGEVAWVPTPTLADLAIPPVTACEDFVIPTTARTNFFRYEFRLWPQHRANFYKIMTVDEEGELTGAAAAEREEGEHTRAAAWPGVLECYCRLADPTAAVSVLVLMAMADANAPAIFGYRGQLPELATMWVPTMEWSVYCLGVESQLAASPLPERWVWCRWRLIVTDGRLMVEDCEILHPLTKRLLVASRQLGLLGRPPGRSRM
jgi:hypothetical protein